MISKFADVFFVKFQIEFESLLLHDHALSFGIVVNDLIHLFKVDGTTFVYIDGIEALFVSLFVPNLVRVGGQHELFAEIPTLIDV